MGLLKRLRRWRQPDPVAAWLSAGRPAPVPHAIKVRNILALADIFHSEALIETGTFRGDMIAATLDRFERIYSIEIQPDLASRAAERFRAHADKVRVLCGDSTLLLPEVLASELPERVLFWLDGHYSGGITGRGEIETPILAEIEAIAAARRDRRDVILIDDARIFDGGNDYPSRDTLSAFIASRLGRQATIANDAFVVLPPCK